MGTKLSEIFHIRGKDQSSGAFHEFFITYLLDTTYTPLLSDGTTNEQNFQT